jgi:long-chain acyl-CoA synthetase
MVASGMLIALAELLEGSQRPVYHLGASDSNPCAMPRYLELAGLYKRRQVFDGKRTKIFDLVSARFESLTIEKKQYEAHGSRRIAGALKGLGKVFGAASVGPLASVFKPAAKALAAAGKAEDRTADVMELFIPFVASCEWIFSCANTRAAIARLVPEDRALFQWEPEKIDWRLWMWDVHLPGLEKWVYPLIEEKTQRELKALRPYETLVDMLDEAAERHEHSVALQELGPEGLSRTTFREWSLASRAVAARLVEAGVEKGDRVVISARNQPAWPIAYFGILRAGAVAVPVDPALEADAFANVARAAKAKVALWDADVARRVDRAVRAAVPAVRAYDLAAFADADGVDDGLDTSLPAIAADDLASLIYTSGTTGEPKGVMLSHKNFCSLVAALAPVFELTSKDRILGVLPLHHTFEFTCGLLLPLSRGARVVYLDELTGDRVGEALKKARITGMVGVPALWQMLERRIVSKVKDQGPAASMAFDWALELNRMVGKTAGLNLGKLLFGPVHAALGGGPRFLISGGAALPRDTAKLFAGLGMPLSEGYGLTEAAPVLTVAKASPKLALGQVGKAIPGVEIKIDKPDATGVGEVLARGPNVMLGYEGNAEATSAAIDEQGWLHTGDLGRFDKRKQLVLVGRQKDVIVSANGENVYPDDVEARLGKVKGVKELAIVGLDDGRGGERVGCLAVVERSTASGAEPDVVETPRAERHERASRELKEAFGELAKATQPAVVHLVDADLPRTATRKVKRNEVRQILERLVAASAAPEADASGAVVSGVRHAVATIANKKPSEISASTNLKSDLGFDSLMALELAAALEAQIGKPLDQGRLAACERVGELEDVVRDAGGASVVEGAAIEREEAAPIEIPPVVAEVAKRWMGRVQMGFYEHAMKPRVTGRAFIPHNRNTIVASNHASHLDMGFVKYALGDYGDGIVSLAAQDYFFEGDRLRRAYFENLTNLAAFDRKNGLRQALRQAGDIIDQGKTVLLFPEGTRSPDGAVHEFKPIIGHLALAHEVDILPVYLGGTFDALPKGRSVPTKRAIVARIGPPLEVAELRRLTEGMRASAASRKVAELAHAAVIALRDGKVLDLKTIGRADEIAVKEHPLVTLFRELEAKYVAGSVEKPVTYYFTLGTENEAKWTLRIAPDGCQATIGKPAGSNADCVLKTTPEMFTRIVKEAYTPTPMEFMTGLVKSNDIALLQTFQKAFHLV